jgi:hypothetical protein
MHGLSPVGWQLSPFAAIYYLEIQSSIGGLLSIPLMESTIIRGYFQGLTMNRDQPPCNACVKHDCRACVWTSPLDASYRNFIQSHSLLSVVALDVRNDDPAPSEPSWLAIAGKRLIHFFKASSRMR